MFKRVTTLLICFFILFVSTFSMPVFAGTGEDNDGIPVGYSPAGLNDQVDAFRSYCKSRNLAIEGSAIDTVTYVTSTIYQHLVADAGLDINELQNEIYKNTKDNVGAQWFFTTTGIAAYNRLFAELLQNNNLAVGDQVEDLTAWQGERFVDDDGNSCIVFVIDKYQNSSNANSLSQLKQRGTYLKYSGSTLNSMMGTNTTFNASFNIFGRTYTGNISGVGQLSNGLGFSKYNSTRYNTQVVSVYDDYWVVFANTYLDGGCAVYKIKDGTYYIGSVSIGKYYPNENTEYFAYKGVAINRNPASSDSNSSITNQTVYYTTNNNTINNNNYEGDTYITNEGDVIENNPVQPGGKDPGWNVGGGQGSYDDGNGNSYTINFPDFELPDLNIDWSINGLGEKFPFSIPFDIAALVTVLNAEPEAPRFQGTVNFGFTTWDYDINLQQFDTVAQVCRIAELLLLVFGLILITRSIIKG